MKEIIIGYNEHKPGEPDPLWTAWEQTGEIVRCKDCRKNMMCEITLNKPKNWFCADGERKDS